MKFFRWLLVLPLLVILFLFALVYPVVNSMASFATDSSNLKMLFDKSTIYVNLLDIIKEQAQIEIDRAGGELDIAQIESYLDPTTEVGRIVNDLAKPDFLKASVEETIDGTYLWLEGKAAKPEFKITLFENNAQFEEVLTVSLNERINSLPICETAPVEFNPFEADCQPADFSREDMEVFFAKVRTMPEYEQLYNSATLDSTKLFNIKPEDTELIQRGYQVIRFTPVISSSLILLVLLLIVLIAPKGRGRFIMPALTLLLVALLLGGAVLFVSAPLYEFMIQNTVITGVGETSAVVIVNSIKYLYDFMMNRSLWFLLPIGILSLTLFVLGFLPFNSSPKSDSKESVTPVAAPFSPTANV